MFILLMQWAVVECGEGVASFCVLCSRRMLAAEATVRESRRHHGRIFHVHRLLFDSGSARRREDVECILGTTVRYPRSLQRSRGDWRRASHLVLGWEVGAKSRLAVDEIAGRGIIAFHLKLLLVFCHDVGGREVRRIGVGGMRIEIAEQVKDELLQRRHSAEMAGPTFRV